VANTVQPAAPVTRTHTLLEPFIFLPDLQARDRDAALAEMVGAFRAQGVLRDPGTVLRQLRDREALGSTGIGKGVALPHARSLAVNRAHVVFARCQRGIDWSAPDGQPVQLLFLMLAPDTAPWHKHYLELLAHLANVVRLARNRQKLLDADSIESAAVILKALS
jgi:mannitol/fructose-specific phosphotransferase system IIA component (Ntr-type)